MNFIHNDWNSINVSNKTPSFALTYLKLSSKHTHLPKKIIHSNAC